MQTNPCWYLDKHYTVFLCESDCLIGILHHFLGTYGAWVLWPLVDAEYGLYSDENRSCINKWSDVITGTILLNWSMITLMDPLLKYWGYCSFALSHWVFSQTVCVLLLGSIQKMKLGYNVQLTVTILSVKKNPRGLFQHENLFPDVEIPIVR